MARIFLCAPALAQYILTSEWDEAMPKAFCVTPERLEKLRARVKGTADKEADEKAKAKESDSGTVNGTLVPALEEATI